MKDGVKRGQLFCVQESTVENAGIWRNATPNATTGAIKRIHKGLARRPKLSIKCQVKLDNLSICSPKEWKVEHLDVNTRFLPVRNDWSIAERTELSFAVERDLVKWYPTVLLNHDFFEAIIIYQYHCKYLAAI